MQILLERTGGTVSALQGALANHISTGGFSGYARGYLNNFDVFLLSSNVIGIETGLIQIQGFRVQNNTIQQATVVLQPSVPTPMHLIAILDIKLDAENSSCVFDVQPIRTLRSDNIFKTGQGVNEVELARFVATSTGIIDLIKTIEPLELTQEDISGLLERVTTAENNSNHAIAEVERLEQLVTAGGTVVTVADIVQPTLNFTSDPQLQLNTAIDSINQFENELDNLSIIKAPKESPTFTGTVVLPTTTSIGNISSTELEYIGGVTSPVQTQINNILDNSNLIQGSRGSFAAGYNASATGIGLVGGGAIGYNAKTDMGGSIGGNSSSVSGGAIGYGTRTETGGAVGHSATSINGFAGGHNAVASGTNSVQLSGGTNSTANTLQFRTFPLVDASGLIPIDRLTNVINRIPTATLLYSATATTGTKTIGDVSQYSFIQFESSTNVDASATLFVSSARYRLDTTTYWVLSSSISGTTRQLVFNRTSDTTINVSTVTNMINLRVYGIR